MTNTELKQFYERLYFQEVESRDKLHARLQLPLTLVLALIGAVAFLFQNFDYQLSSWTAQRVAFLFFFISGSAILLFALIRFVNALYNNEYYFLPDSKKTAEYRALLEKTYEEFEDRETLVLDALDKYKTDYYIEYAAFNTQTNDRRSAYIHQCNGAIIGATVLFIAAYLAFYFGDLDRSRIKPAIEIFVTKPIDVRVQDRK